MTQKKEYKYPILYSCSAIHIYLYKLNVNDIFVCTVPELGGLARRAAGCSSAFSAPSPAAHHDPGKIKVFTITVYCLKCTYCIYNIFVMQVKESLFSKI